MQNLCSKDFFKKCTYNFDTQNQLWCSQLADSHDNFCSCKFPFAHLLATIFPPGHKDRKLTIDQILERDYTELCHSGGEEETGHGTLTTTEDAAAAATEEEGFPEDELEGLLSAAAATATPQRR
jgi:hypothetical protein